MSTNEIEFSAIKGLTFASVERIGQERIVFTSECGDVYTLYHEQDCCERVEIESITGDLADLVGTPILLAEVAESGSNPANAKPETIEYQDSFTWTFYKLATIKGYVDIRWYGESNGYYSESVTFVRGTHLTWGIA